MIEESIGLTFKRVHWLVNGIFKRLGLRMLKEWAWNREFSSGRWDYLIEGKTKNGALREAIGDYIDGGSILDLGCGQGNMSYELRDLFSIYTGVDLSTVAIKTALSLSDDPAVGRKAVGFVVGDIETYTPEHDYNVILFNESVYYLQPSKIPGTIRRYAGWLEREGAILIKVHDAKKHRETISAITRNFRIAQEITLGTSGLIIVIRRPI